MPGKPDKRTRKNTRARRDDEEAGLEEWGSGESDLPESVIPQLDPNSIVTEGSSPPPSKAELEREAQARAEVERENRTGDTDDEIEITDIATQAQKDIEDAIAAGDAADQAEETDRKVKEILDEQRELLDSIEAPKRAAAAEAERQRQRDAEKKARTLDLSWRRIAAGIVLFAALGYGCTQIVGGDETASDSPQPVDSDDQLIAVAAAGDENVQDEDVPDEADSVEPATAAENGTEEAARPPGSGTTEIDAFVNSACGGLYDVFLRVLAFNNFQITVDQLSTKGGNPFQSAAGWADSRVAMATMTQEDFFEVWFLMWNLGDLLAIYNVYGTSADFSPPANSGDVAQYADVDSAEALATAVGASADSCASEVQIREAVTTPFPDANA